MWRRKSRPRPLPSLAPGMRPGTSAIVYVLPRRDDPQVGRQRGERVVGDLRPRRATAPRSARTCPRSGSRPARRRPSSAARARGHAFRRARRAARTRAPCATAGQRGVAEPAASATGGDEPGAAPVRSPSTSPSASSTTVPSGTAARCPRRWRRCEAPHARLAVARPRVRAGWKSSRVCTPGSTTSTTSPPCPPFPPSGPPSGMNFSRWIAAQPCPPFLRRRASPRGRRTGPSGFRVLPVPDGDAEGAGPSPGPTPRDGLLLCGAQAETVSSAGTMLTVLRPRFSELDGARDRANSVSSPPRPTPSPGWNLVPRWRTRISPALTTGRRIA